MRPYLAVALFALAALAAACGGGAGGGSTPVLPTAAGPTSAPLKSAQAKLSIKIPAQSRGSSIRRPAYVSPNTQSVQVFASLVGATASPSPQTFPVATPSPCTQNPDGSKSCTFNVQAPIGMDNFVVKTFADPNPGPTSSPLAVFESGAVNVANGGTPPTLSFTLTGVIASVDVAMQSPNASVTPSTQIATVGQPIQLSALGITPRDASGSPILTDTFSSPITVALSPATAGVSFGLANSQCSPASTVSGTTATITCAKDLGALSFSYNGTIARDSSKNVIDRILFAASTSTQTGTGSPGYLALTGTSIAFTMPAATPGSISGMRFAKNPDGTLSYLTEGFVATIGRLDPSNPAGATAIALPYESSGMTVDHSGNIWAAETYSTSSSALSAIDCYAPGSSTPSSSISIQTPGSPNPVQPFALTTDASGNIWFYGNDPGGNEWAGFVGPNVCASAPPFAIANVPISGPIGDAQDAQAQNGGGVLLLSRTGGLFSATTSGTVTPIASPPNFGSGSTFAVDGSGNSYAGFTMDGPPSFIAMLPNAANSFTTLQNAPDTQQPQGMSTDGGSPASSFAYADNFDGDIGVGDASTLGHIALANAGSGSCYATFFDANGDAWGACSNGTTTTLRHIIRTSMWTAIVPSNLQVFQGSTVSIGIVERGYSGPFTATVSDPTTVAVNTPPAGYEHTIPLAFNATAAGSVILTITDAHGVSQTFPVSWTYSLPAARRHGSARAPRHRPH